MDKIGRAVLYVTTARNFKTGEFTVSKDEINKAGIRIESGELGIKSKTLVDKTEPPFLLSKQSYNSSSS
jgi:hypothetical protein